MEQQLVLLRQPAEQSQPLVVIQSTHLQVMVKHLQLILAQVVM
jgi:hypothetical protein